MNETQPETELVARFERLIVEIIELVTAPGLGAKREQVAGLDRAIGELERIGAPVPGELTALRDGLRCELARADEAKARLFYLQSSLTSLVKRLDVALPIESTARGGGQSRRRITKPRGFVLDGTHYPVTKWIDLLRTLCRVLAERHGPEFERVLILGQGQLRPVFTRDPATLRRPEQVPGTDIYLKLDQNAESVADLAPKIAEVLGYREDQFSILEPD
jgi:hypothetical protein